MPGIPRLIDVTPEERIELFKKKVQLASFVLDFSRPNSQLREKEIKKQEILDLTSWICVSGLALTLPELYQPIFLMLQINLLRSLPSKLSYDEDENMLLDAAWSHTDLVYQFFLACLRSPHWSSASAQPYLTTSFIRQLVRLFDTEEPRERQHLKNILHRIYNNVVSLRGCIRLQIGNIFLEFIHEGRHHNGIAELLTVLESIIDGFMTPLREEHRNFFHRILVLLYKNSSYKQYHQQLTQCVVRFVRKDPQLVAPLFSSILRFWPKSESERQVLLLKDIGVLLPRLPPSQIPFVIVPIFKKIGLCIACEHFMTAEVALSLFSQEGFIIIAADNIHIVLPILFGPINYSLRNHWHYRTRAMCDSILQLFAEIDPERYAFYYNLYSSSADRDEKDRWAELDREAIIAMEEG